MACRWIRFKRRRAVALVIGALARNSAVATPCHGPARLSCAVGGDALGGFSSAAQYGDDWRESAAANAVRLTSATRRMPATSVSRARAARRSADTIGCWRCWARSADCIASNPSDQNVALTALEATIQVQGPKGERSMPIDEFYLQAGIDSHRETVSGARRSDCAASRFRGRSGSPVDYLKLRDRAAYEFAL